MIVRIVAGYLITKQLPDLKTPLCNHTRRRARESLAKWPSSSPMTIPTIGVKYVLSYPPYDSGVAESIAVVTLMPIA